jgi:Tol biopolymer transport system component
MTEQRKKHGRTAGVLGATAALVASGLVWSLTPAHAGFPGNTGKLACQSGRTGNNEIFAFDPSGTEVNPVNLSNHPSSDTRPRYSPDGRTIVFESNRTGFNELWLMNADGSNQRQLTFSPAGGHGNGAANFSPGGDQIAYQSTRDGNFNVYRIDIDGKNDTRLTNLAVEESLPAWSPNGDKIAFNSRRVDPSADVHLMNPDGTGDVDLTNNPGTEDSWPAWSPDGSMIAFHSRRDDALGEEIYRMNANGTGVVRLTNNIVPGDAVKSFDVFPAWSPDGTRITWTSGRLPATNFGEVWVMNASDGGNIVRISANDAIEQRCDWQPLCTIYGAGTIVGTPGNDIICGSEGGDQIYGNGGNDRILGLGGNDQIFGAAGNDMLFGGAGFDRIFGQGGTDVADGGIGGDQCIASTTRSCP